jgi:hypothetical protein
MTELNPERLREPTLDEVRAFNSRTRLRNLALGAGTANDNGAGSAPVGGGGHLPGLFMQTVRPDILTNLRARDPIYGGHYWRGYVGATISLGGQGKSSLVIAECLAIATGRDLLGIIPNERVPVFYFNGEDPLAEVDLRVAAIMQRYNIEAEELEGWFFYASGRDTPLLIAEQNRDGTTIVERNVRQIITEAKANRVGLIVLDPLVSVHAVEENSNGAIDRLVKGGIGRIAQEVGGSVEVVHHTRKTNGNQTTVEDGRGASALHAAARSVRTLNRASEKDCKALGIPLDDAWKYLRVDHGKSNMTPPKKAEWYMLVSEQLDAVVQRTGLHIKQSVQVIERWYPPQAAGALTALEIAAMALVLEASPHGTLWRWSSQTGVNWAGRAVEAVRVVAAPEPLMVHRSIADLTKVLDFLITAGVLEKREQPDGRGKSRPVVAVCSGWQSLEKDPVAPVLVQELADKALAWLAGRCKAAA